MAQKFFLLNAANGAANLPTSEQGAGTPTNTWANADSAKLLSPTAESTQQTVTSTNAATGTRRHFCRRWVSDPLAAGTYGAGTWAVSLAHNCSNIAQPFNAGLVNIYFWRPGTGKVGTVVDQSNDATTHGTAPSSTGEKTTYQSFTGSGVTIQDGDVLCVEIWDVWSSSSAVSRTLTLYFGGTTESTTDNATVSNIRSFVEAPGNIPLMGAVLAAAGSCASTGTADLTAPQAIERAAGFTVQSVHQAAGAGNSLTTGTFNVPAGGHVLVAAVMWAATGGGGGGDPGLPTITDNQGTHLNWTEVDNSEWSDANWNSYLRMFVADAPDAITGLTVTGACAGTFEKIGSLTVDCLKGPGLIADCIGGKAAYKGSEATSQACAVTVAATAAQSWIAGVWFDGNSATALTADSNTTPADDHFEDSTYGCAMQVGHRTTGLTSGAGNYTIGSTATDPYVLYVGVELKKAAQQQAALVAAGTCGSTGVAALTTAILLAAVGSCGSSASATFAGDAAALAAAGSAQTTGTAALTTGGSSLQAAGSGSVAGEADLTDSGPTISPVSGVYTSTRSVTITKSGRTGGTIRYTTDGSRPTGSSTAYSGAFNVTATGLVRAAVFDTGYESPMATAWYAIESTGTKIGPDHVVRTDGDSKLISWLPQEIAYGEVVKRICETLLHMNLESGTGLPQFLFHSYLDANLSPATGWPSAPGGQIAMMADSAIQAFPYTGDVSTMNMVKMLLTYLIRHGRVASGSWAGAFFNEADPGDVDFGGADYAGNGWSDGVGDGVGNLEPDKQAEIGWACLMMYMHDPSQTQLRDAAIACADALCANRVTGTSASISPWPFRVKASDNSMPTSNAGEKYCSNLQPYIRLFDGLVRLGLGSTSNYTTARNAFWTWATTYPLSSGGDAGPWGHYFEDQPWSTVYTDDANQLNPNNMARLLLEQPSLTSNYLTWAEALCAYAEGAFGTAQQYGAIPMDEQDWYTGHPMGSHTSRLGAVHALIYAATSNATNKDKAYRALNWTTYMNRTDGYSLDGYPNPNQIWMTDGFGDTIRHFAVAMYAVPEWAPAAEDHLLGSTSVVQKVAYHVNRVSYRTYDAAAYETLRLSFTPTSVTAGGSALSSRSDLAAEGYVWNGSTGVLKIRHDSSGTIEVSGGSAAALAAVGSAASTGTAALTTGIPLAAAGSAGTTCAAALTTGIPLVATAGALTTGTGALTTGIPLAASGSASVTGAAALTTGIPLAAVASAASTGTAALSTAIRLAAAGQAQVTGLADITGAAALAAAGGAQVTAQASLTTGIPLAAAAGCSTTGLAALTTGIRLAAAAVAEVVASATLSGGGAPAALAAAGSAGTSATAALTTGIPLAAVAVATSSGAAALSTQIRLAAVAVCTTIASAYFGPSVSVVWEVTVQAQATQLAIVAAGTDLTAQARPASLTITGVD